MKQAEHVSALSCCHVNRRASHSDAGQHELRRVSSCWFMLTFSESEAADAHRTSFRSGPAEVTGQVDVPQVTLRPVSGSLLVRVHCPAGSNMWELTGSEVGRVMWHPPVIRVHFTCQSSVPTRWYSLTADQRSGPVQVLITTEIKNI